MTGVPLFWSTITADYFVGVDVDTDHIMLLMLDQYVITKPGWSRAGEVKCWFKPVNADARALLAIAKRGAR